MPLMFKKYRIPAKFCRIQVVLLIMLCVLFLPRMSATAQSMTDYRIAPQLVISAGSQQTIDSRRIKGYSSPSDMPLILVRNGATLRIQNSEFDLSTVGNRIAIKVEEGGTLILDNTKVFGGYGSTPYAWIMVEKGDLQVINGSHIENNHNEGSENYDCSEHYPDLGYCPRIGNIIRVVEGTITFDHAFITNNRVNTVGDALPYSGGVISARGTDVTIKDTEVLNNKDDNWTIFEINNTQSLHIENSSFENNECRQHGVFWLVNVEEITVGSGSAFKKNSAHVGPCFTISHASSINIEDNVVFAEKFGNIGGAIYSHDELNMTIGKAEFISNKLLSTVNGGAAIRHLGGSLTLNGTIFKDNSIPETPQDFDPTFFSAGGAVATSDTNVTINEGTRFEGNTGGIGGALGLSGGSLTITNGVTFSDNRAYTDGGAIHARHCKSFSIGNDNTFTQNTAVTDGGAIFAQGLQLFIGDRNVFSDNQSEYGAVYLEKPGEWYDPEEYPVSLTIGNENSFINNQNSAIYTWDGPVQIGDRNLFSGNESNRYGGALYLETDQATIGNENLFENNKASESGGAIIFITSQRLVKITVGSSVFRKNHAENVGGAIDFGSYAAVEHADTDILFDGTVFTENTAGQAGGAADCGNGGNYTFRNTTFSDNRAGHFAGALYTGYGTVSVSTDIINDYYQYAFDKEWKYIFNTITIESSSFIGNRVTDAMYPFEGGGAILIADNSHVILKNLQMDNNIAEKGGAGIASAPELFIKPGNGASVYDNHIGSNTGEKQDIYLISADSETEISEKMFSGGNHHWTVTDGISAVLPDGKAVTGQYWTSAPFNKEYDGDAVIMTQNEVRTAPDADPLAGLGGAIANYGFLTIGEDTASIRISKTWDDDTVRDLLRPDHRAFLSAISVASEGKTHTSGDVVHLEAEDGENSEYFYDRGDPDITYILETLTEDEFALTIDGLPVPESGGFEVTESMEYYRPEVTRQQDGSFRILNTWNGELPHTPTPEPSPTPEVNFFKLFEGLRELPQTGFPGETAYSSR